MVSAQVQHLRAREQVPAPAVAIVGGVLSHEQVAEERAEAGSPVPDGFARYLNLEARTAGFSSAEEVVDAAGRAAALGYTDVVIGWPRPDGPMAGDPALLEAVAARLPEVHAL